MSDMSSISSQGAPTNPGYSLAYFVLLFFQILAEMPCHSLFILNFYSMLPLDA